MGSLIGMENAINRAIPYDASKLVAFPPLWVAQGAKIVRQHEAELNWKDRSGLNAIRRRRFQLTRNLGLPDFERAAIINF